MSEIKYDYQAETICFIRDMKEIDRKEIPDIFGDVIRKHDKVEAFMARGKKNARVIPADKLELYDVALFQIKGKDMIRPYSLSDIMVDFEIDRKTGKVTAKKLYRYREKYELETRTYYIGNYNRTWRAWTALPEENNAGNWRKR